MQKPCQLAIQQFSLLSCLTRNDIILMNDSVYGKPFPLQGQTGLIIQ